MGKMATREAYGKALAELIVENPNVVVLDADLSGSTKTKDAKNACPERHFNMGIAEGNMMAVAAGLAAQGNIVYASSFAMFAAGRAYEQIRNSICYPNLNVKVCATHSGITVGEDGASHQCVEDLALMRVIPNMHVFQPCDARETAAIIKEVAKIDGPCYVRLGRLGVEDVYNDDNFHFEVGKGNVVKEGKDVVVIASGYMVQQTLGALDALAAKGVTPTVIDMHTIKPIDEELILKTCKDAKLVVTCEEHSVIGGLGSAVSEVLSKKMPKRMCMIGLQDEFGQSGTPAALMHEYKLDSEGVAEQILKALED